MIIKNRSSNYKETVVMLLFDLTLVKNEKSRRILPEGDFTFPGVLLKNWHRLQHGIPVPPSSPLGPAPTEKRENCKKYIGAVYLGLVPILGVWH